MRLVAAAHDVRRTSCGTNHGRENMTTCDENEGRSLQTRKGGRLCHGKVGNLPFVRRYRKGKKKTYYGEWDIDSVMQVVTE
mmetsp:Transcript_74027/g.149756  ORF Transcript_74027/g.149756 Transcript_74027/m.149756 type:complete len:81 (+) Transcript_74027:211-453(+)